MELRIPYMPISWYENMFGFPFYLFAELSIH